MKTPPGVIPEEKKRVDIHIGEFHASVSPTVIYTLLGSCVAACLFDPASRVGGMNHILLPGQADLNKFDAPARYGVNAMELLINRIIKLGGNRSRLRAKVFGGAHVLRNISPDLNIGKKISEFVLSFLKMEKIPVTGQDVGGNDTRKIFFHTDTGDVFLKRVPTRYLADIARLEEKALEKIDRVIQKPAEITLFDFPLFQKGKNNDS